MALKNLLVAVAATTIMSSAAFAADVTPSVKSDTQTSASATEAAKASPAAGKKVKHHKKGTKKTDATVKTDAQVK